MLLQTRASGPLGDYDQVLPLLDSIGPASWREVRERAYRRFVEFGVPSIKDEEFRYVPLKVLDEAKFKPAYGATVDRHQLGETLTGKLDAITLTFVNGQYAPELSSADSLPDGVIVMPLDEAAMMFPELVESRLGRIVDLSGRLGSTNDQRFVDLNTAYLGEGAFVHVPRGVVLERPVHLVFLNQADHGPFAVYPRTLVILEDAAQAKVVESHLGRSGVYFTNAVTEVEVGRDAFLEHALVQDETSDSVHLATIGVHQAAGSNYQGHNANFGAQICRKDLNVWLDGEHTETWLNGANVGTRDQVVDNHTRIDHAKPNCHSFEVYKSILADRSTGVFNGKIFVYVDAQKTDAKQTNQAILLSPQATMNTKPQLEIFADDVKCTHGATIGQLREDALFYLRARGIPEMEAKGLLVYAFAAEVLERITMDDLREALEARLFAKLAEVR
ncbi:Fe-S cluster assembly protein SufD [soil metagenome]